MFNVTGLLQAPTIYYIPLKEGNSHQLRPNEVMIKFADGSSALYERESLSELEAFRNVKNCPVLELPIKQSIFLSVLRLTLEKRPLWDALEEESYKNPFLYEELLQALQACCLSAYPSIRTSIEHQLEWMTLKNAETCINAYMVLKSSQPQVEMPLCVKAAKSLWIKSKFFSTRERVEVYFGTYMDQAKELFLCEPIYKNLEVAFANPANTVVQKKLIQTQMESLKKNIDACRRDMDDLAQKLKFENLSIWCKHLLSQYCNDEDPELQALAKKGKASVEAYRESILKCLESTNCKVNNKAVLEYVIGPKGFLFEYYSLEINPHPRDPRYPLINRVCGMECHYLLENETPFDLEEEIRSDFATSYKRENKKLVLPERLIATRTEAFVSEEAKALTDEIMPILNKWTMCSDEVKTSVKRKFIEFNKWDKEGIATENIEFNPPGILPTQLTGSVRKAHIDHPFRMNLSNCIMIIPRYEGDIAADSMCTLETIREMMQF